MTLIYILGTTFTISVLSLIGVFLFSKNEKNLQKLVSVLVGLSTGILLGGSFFHLIPEGVELIGLENALALTLISFSTFFLIEKLIRWHHCHDGECEAHTSGQMNMVGDVVHTFLDGLLVAGAFAADYRLGFITVFAVAVHEIPLGFSDFVVLVHAGMTRKKALFVNFLISLSAVAGGLFGYLFLSTATVAIGYLVPIAAGGFLYVSTSDLIPELKRETNFRKSLTSFFLFTVGLLIMAII